LTRFDERRFELKEEDLVLEREALEGPMTSIFYSNNLQKVPKGCPRRVTYYF
jgi:hypothetical protein